MEREKIIKALECCKSFRDFYMCDECPYSKAILADDESCTNRMSQDALSLIKELTEEVERLEKVKYIFSTVDYCADDLAKALEENKRLGEENERLENVLIEQSAENVMLIGENKRLRACTNLVPTLNEVKADTVRKMQERLHERFGEDSNRVFSNYNIHRYIDQIAEEMLSDGK